MKLRSLANRTYVPCIAGLDWIFHVDGPHAMTSLIRSHFLDLIEYALTHQIGLVLYTAASANYAQWIYQSLESVVCDRYRADGHHPDIPVEIFDAVIASGGQLKTLALVDAVMPLQQFTRVFVLDDNEKVEFSL